MRVRLRQTHRTKGKGHVKIYMLFNEENRTIRSNRPAWRKRAGDDSEEPGGS